MWHTKILIFMPKNSWDFNNLRVFAVFSVRDFRTLSIRKTCFNKNHSIDWLAIWTGDCNSIELCIELGYCKKNWFFGKLWFFFYSKVTIFRENKKNNDNKNYSEGNIASNKYILVQCTETLVFYYLSKFGPKRMGRSWEITFHVKRRYRHFRGRGGAWFGIFWILNFVFFFLCYNLLKKHIKDYFR